MGRGARVLLLVVLLAGWCAHAPAPLAAGAAVSLEMGVTPGTVRAGSEVTYTVTATNAGDADVSSLDLQATLPPGFSYVAGSTALSLNGARLPAVAPTAAGSQVTWRSLKLPAARPAGVFGINSFLQDSCENTTIDWQLDRVKEAFGSGAYVKQLFYGITPQTAGPMGCWSHFVYAAYDRGLIPVVRLGGTIPSNVWSKPPADAPGDYTSIAEACKRVIAGLPLRPGQPIYVEVWNEPNLRMEWSNDPNPTEYGQFLVDVAAALRSLNDPRIVIMNGALSPGGEYNNLAFIDALANVPGALQAFDVWATHPYPGNHPPEYNSHDGTAVYPDMAIDSYVLELNRLAAHGRTGLRVLITETGYALNANDYGFEGYPPASEQTRADYMARAFRDYWSRWPEVLGVCPYELVDQRGAWNVWDWLYPDGRHHAQYDSVAALNKTATPASSKLTLTFRARAGQTAGTFASSIAALSGGATLASRSGVAPVVVQPAPATLTPTPSPTGPTPTPGPSPTPSPCQEMLRNGGFEGDNDWSLLGGSHPTLVTEQARNGSRSLRLGVPEGANLYAFSSAEQVAVLPAAASATLSFWYKVSGEDIGGDKAYVLARGADMAYVKLGDLDLNARDWTYVAFDTSLFAGQDAAVRLTAVNDGTGGVLAVYVDDASWCAGNSVAMTATPTATGTPLPTASATASATPAATPVPTSVAAPGCSEALADGAMEAGDGWRILDTAYKAAYVAQPVHSGAQALRLGITAGSDLASYSSAEQTVSIPLDATAVRLSYWINLATADTTGDVQYLLVLDAAGGYTSPLWTLANAPYWQRREVSLDDYRGQTVTLRFGVRNDGDGAITAMVVDSVALSICYGTVPTPYPTPTASPAPTATAVPGAGSMSHSLALPLMVLPGVGGADAGAGAQSRGSTPAVRSYRALALDPELGRVFAVADDGVWMWPQTGGGPAERWLAGSGYQGLLMDAGARRLYVSDWESGSVLALDPADGRVLARAGGLLRPSGLALFGERLFVAEMDSDRIVVLDRGTCGIMGATPVGAAPYALAVDAQRGRVWVADAGQPLVTVLDARTAAPIGAVRLDGLGHPQGLAVDAKRGRVYVSYLVSARYHAIAALDAAGLRIVQVRRGDAANPLTGAYGLAVDPASGKVYVSDVGGLLALDPQSLAPHRVAAQAGFVPPLGAVFDATSGDLLMADTGGTVASVKVGRAR